MKGTNVCMHGKGINVCLCMKGTKVCVCMEGYQCLCMHGGNPMSVYINVCVYMEG